MFWKTTLLFVLLFSFHFEFWSQENFFQNTISEYESFHKKQLDSSALVVAKKILHWCELNEKDTSIRIALSHITIATAYSAVEENDSANFYFKKSIELLKYQKREKTDDYLKLLNSYAGFNKKIGDFANAELYYLYALELCSDTSKIDKAEYARLLNNYADYFLILGDAEKADSLVQEALNIYKKVHYGDKSKYSSCLHTRAMTLFSLGYLPEAQIQFQEWLNIIDTMANKNISKMNGILDYSELLIKLEKYNDARNKLNQAQLLLNKKEFNIRDKLNAKYYETIGLLEFKQNIDFDSKTCLSHYFNAQNILEKDTTKFFKELSGIWEGIADIYIKHEKYDSAFFYSEKALNSRKYHFRELNPDYASSLNQISKIYKALGQYEKALKIRLKALEIRRIVLSLRHPDYAASLNNLGNLYKILGDFQNAEKYYLEALEIRKIVFTEKHSHYAASLHNLGELYFDEGDYRSASNYFEKCIEIKKSLQAERNVDLANSLKEFARVHIEIGNYKEAENLLKEVLAIYSKAQDKTETSAYATTLCYLGLVYYKMKDFEKADKEYKKSLDIIAKNSGINSGIKLYANVMYYQGRNYLKLEKTEFKQAEKCFRECLSIRRQLFKGNDEHPDIAKAYKNFGDLFLVRKEYDSSLYYYNKSLMINKKIFGVNHKETIKRQFEIAKLYDEWGKKQEAFELYSKLFALKTKEISNNFEWLSDDQKELYWNLENEFYNELFQFGNENYHTIPGLSSLNYNVSLIMKGKLLENKISSENYYQEIDEIREELSMKRRMLAKIDSDGIVENDTALIIMYDKLDKEIDSLDTQLRNTWPEYQQQKQNLEITWDKIEVNLALGEAAIEFIRYYNKKDSSYYYNALVLKSGDKVPTIVPLFNEKELQKILPQSGFSQYYNLIWKPIEYLLSNINTIYYSPTGELNKVPFHAIYAPVSGGDKIISRSSDNRGIVDDNLDVETEENSHFLIDTYSLHQLTSTRYLALGIKQKSNEAIEPIIALIGGIDYDYLSKPEYRKPNANNDNPNAKRSSVLTGSKLNYLEGTKLEITAISNLLTPLLWKIEVFTDQEAKEENIMRLEGKYAKSILHIATHGYSFQDERFNEKRSNTNTLNYNYRFSKNPMVRSGLILAGGNWAWTGSDTLSKLGAEQNGILTALEVSHLNLKKTKLVVLSACETGLGKIEGSEGTFGLKRGFKLAGVEQIIVSLWSVPDKETMELMTLFYSDLTKTLNPVISFEKAQKEMRNLYPTDPNKWAGFVLVR